MPTYNDLKDNRTDEEYQEYFEAGIYNQEILLEQLRKDWWYQNGIMIAYKWVDKNQKFTKNISEIDRCKPDVLIYFETMGVILGRCYYEVKVGDKEFGEFVHLKEYQMKKCLEFDSKCRLLFSSPIVYFSILISEVIKYPLVEGQKWIGGKPCYRLPVKEMTLQRHSMPLLVKNYPKFK